MNIKQIKSLADILKESDLSVLDISEGELHIHMERGTAAAPAAVALAPAAVLSETAPAESLLPEDRSSELDFNDAKDIKAPMVGVFYSAPQPGRHTLCFHWKQGEKGRCPLHHRGHEAHERDHFGF